MLIYSLSEIKETKLPYCSLQSKLYDKPTILCEQHSKRSRFEYSGIYVMFRSLVARALKILTQHALPMVILCAILWFYLLMW